MSKRDKLIAVLALVIFCALIVFAWSRTAEVAAIESVTNIALSGDAVLTERHSHSTRFGAEGLRIWVYRLSKPYSTELNSKCNSLGYNVQATQTLLTNYPFLRSYIDSVSVSCVRVVRDDFTGIAILQDGQLIVAFII